MERRVHYERIKCVECGVSMIVMLLGDDFLDGTIAWHTKNTKCRSAWATKADRFLPSLFDRYVVRIYRRLL